MSETRNILDNLGNVIGTMTLPDGSSEDTWSQSLGNYSSTVINLPKSILNTTLLTASSNVTVSTSTALTVGGMTAKPTKGKYIAMFSGSISTNGASATGEFGFYVDDVLLSETKRPISCNLQLLGGLVTVSLNTIGVGTNTSTEVSLNGNQTIDVKFKSTNGGTIGFNERTMILIRSQE